MTDTANAPLMRKFTLDFPITLGGKVLIEADTEIMVRKPGSGEMRGLQLTPLLQGDVTALETLAPRITSPIIQKGAVLDPADLLQFAGEVMDFLLPKAAREAASPTM